jgi:hypothetical protein
VKRTAEISPCKLYRHLLGREFEPGDELYRPGLHGSALFVLNNPSVADAEIDDPTCRRGMGFTAAWAFARMWFANTNPVRSTDPNSAFWPSKQALEWNDWYLHTSALVASVVVVAWGDKARDELATRALRVLRGVRPVHALALSQAGRPRHLLYLPADLKPVPYLGYR